MLNYPPSRVPLEISWQSFLLSFSNLSSLFSLSVEQLENSLNCFSPQMAQFLLLLWFTSLFCWHTSSDNFLKKGLACVHFQSCHMFENVRILSSHFISNQIKIFFFSWELWRHCTIVFWHTTLDFTFILSLMNIHNDVSMMKLRRDDRTVCGYFFTHSSWNSTGSFIPCCFISSHPSFMTDSCNFVEIYHVLVLELDILICLSRFTFHPSSCCVPQEGGFYRWQQ